MPPTPADTIIARTLAVTDLLAIMRDTSRDLRDSVRIEAANRLEECYRMMGQLERMLQQTETR